MGISEAGLCAGLRNEGGSLWGVTRHILAGEQLEGCCFFWLV